MHLSNYFSNINCKTAWPFMVMRMMINFILERKYDAKTAKRHKLKVKPKNQMDKYTRALTWLGESLRQDKFADTTGDFEVCRKLLGMRPRQPSKEERPVEKMRV